MAYLLTHENININLILMTGNTLECIQREDTCCGTRTSAQLKSRTNLTSKCPPNELKKESKGVPNHSNKANSASLQIDRIHKNIKINK